MVHFRKIILLFAALWLLPFFGIIMCQKAEPPLFEQISADHSGIDFINTVEEGVGHNVLETEFFYNGGGVAVGDINNDGLSDLFFTANTTNNALYLNRGDFQFENITMTADLTDSTGWTAGASMVDINADGLLDIYVCKAGEVEVEERRNKLFINQGDETFIEQSADYGLDDPGYCTQPAFFDYDRDGDLDVYIVNYSVKPLSGFDLTEIRTQVDSYAGDKLYRNDDGQFKDVSQQAGIQQNPIGFGLSATVSDLNNDGWPDLFVTNDFVERDYMYINQGDGTFHDEIFSRTHLTSYFSMGSDIADIDNDGQPDILVADMLPYEYQRERTFKTPDYSMYDQLAANGYHRQNMRNTLQLNNGDGTFTEVGRLAGISKTDWSWAPLIADFDNDGHKDIFITNGFGRYYTNLDFLNEILWKDYPNENLPEDPEELYRLVQQMDEVQLHNFAFQNSGELSFTDVSSQWGVGQHAISNGTAYADLDNNGTLDLIVNNINERPFIFRNNARSKNGNNYLKIRLQGPSKNPFGVGAKLAVTDQAGNQFFQELNPTRGFQSSMEHVLTLGLGSANEVDVEVTWPDGAQDVRTTVSANKTVTLHRNDASMPSPDSSVTDKKMFLLLNESSMGFNYRHEAAFPRDRIDTPLMPHTLSNLGPALAKGDINSDNLPDLFVGGGPGQPSAIYLQQSKGTFTKVTIDAFQEHRNSEDIDALFFDATGNGHLDLYVVSGGNSDPSNGSIYQDRLYINDGFGNFIFLPDALPHMLTSGATVEAIELDGDGDTDLFIGGRVLTGRYPLAPHSYLLQNDGGRFTDVTEKLAPELKNPGMVTDAVWADLNNNNRPELVVAGEWMPIRIFEQNEDQTFAEQTEAAELTATSGWWNVLKVADLDSDGYLDIIAGNHGQNTLLNASADEPVSIWVGDFNDDGFIDPVMTQIIEGVQRPVPSRDLLLQQLPSLEEKFPDYESYASAAIEDILTSQQMNEAEKLDLHTFSSMVFKNNGDGTFTGIELPKRAQAAPIHDIVISDFDQDSLPDILVTGNNFGLRPESGPLAADGLLLKGDGSFGFSALNSNQTGFYGVGDVRQVEVLPSSIGPLLIVARNGETLIPYLYQRLKQQ